MDEEVTVLQEVSEEEVTELQEVSDTPTATEFPTVSDTSTATEFPTVSDTTTEIPSIMPTVISKIYSQKYINNRHNSEETV